MRFFQRAAALMLLLLLACTASSAGANPSFIYGQSELGRDLVCHRVGSAEADSSILLVFGVHGFEDAYDHDGHVLRMIAEGMIHHYTANTDELQNFCLYIIPSANPDGLIDGTTNHGFGRCNANGFDVNRDFSFNWTEDTTTRNQTGEEPFVTAEARAIRALVEKIQPTYGVDVHGWKKASYGNGKMAEIFAGPFNFKVKRLSTQGMLCAWLRSMTEDAILIELPYPPDPEEYVITNTAKLIEGVNAWIEYCQPDE